MNTPHLVILDMDSTFIQEEVIDLLAAHAGVGQEVAQITTAAMSGGLDFSASLAQRVALLEGLEESVFERVRKELNLSTGAQTLITSLHAAGSFIGVVSGGFENVIAPLLTELGVDAYRANVLEVIDGKLTGKLIGAVVDARAKSQFLTEQAKNFGVAVENTVAVGDGANDLEMIRIAGKGVAFNAKQVVIDAADHVISDGDLAGVLDLVGIKRLN